MLTRVHPQPIFRFGDGDVTMEFNAATRAGADFAQALATDVEFELPRLLEPLPNLVRHLSGRESQLRAFGELESRVLRIPAIGRDLGPNQTAKVIPELESNRATIDVENAYQYALTGPGNFGRSSVMNLSFRLGSADTGANFFSGVDDALTLIFLPMYRAVFSRTIYGFSADKAQRRGPASLNARNIVFNAAEVDPLHREAYGVFALEDPLPPSSAEPADLWTILKLMRDYEFLRALSRLADNGAQILAEGDKLFTTEIFRDARRLGGLMMIARVLEWYYVLPYLFIDALFARVLQHPLISFTIDRMRTRRQLTDFDDIAEIVAPFHKFPATYNNVLASYVPFTAPVPEIAGDTALRIHPLPRGVVAQLMAFSSTTKEERAALRKGTFLETVPGLPDRAPILTPDMIRAAQRTTVFGGRAVDLDVEQLLTRPFSRAGGTESLTLAGMLENRRQLARFLQPLTQSQSGSDASFVRGHDLLVGQLAGWSAPPAAPRLSTKVGSGEPIIIDGGLSTDSVLGLADLQSSVVVPYLGSFGPAAVIPARELPAATSYMFPADPGRAGEIDVLLPSSGALKEQLAPLSPVDPAAYILVDASEQAGVLGDEAFSFTNNLNSWLNELGVSEDTLAAFMSANQTRWAHIGAHSASGFDFLQGVVIRTALTELRTNHVGLRVFPQRPDAFFLTNAQRLRLVVTRTGDDQLFVRHPKRDTLGVSVPDALRAELIRISGASL